MRPSLVILLSIFAPALAGCYDEILFTEDYNAALCERTFECYPEEQLDLLSYDSVDTCVSYWSDETPPEIAENCAFDAAAAKTCVEETRSMSCDDFVAGEQPADCSAWILCE